MAEGNRRLKQEEPGNTCYGHSSLNDTTYGTSGLQLGRNAMNYDSMTIANFPKAEYWFMPCGTFFKVGVVKQPNRFHRFMQRLLFGFRYAKI